MKKAGNASKDYGMHDVGTHHYFGWVTVEEQKQHHDDAARAYRSHSDKKACHQTDDHHAGKRFGRGAPVGYAILDSALQKQQRGNKNKEQANCRLDEVVDTISVHDAQMLQQAHAQNRTGSTAKGKRKHNLPTNRTLAEMYPTGTDFGDEIEDCIRAHRHDGRYFQSKK